MGYLMKVKHSLFILPLFLLASGFLFAQNQEPNRLRREDSFLGIHFDFHAGHSDKNIGQNVTEEMVDAIIEMIGPDFIQIDTKGHAGVTSYPSRFNNHAEPIYGDPMRVWRDATARHGVALYSHYSGIYDSNAGAQHPEWEAVNARGDHYTGKMSTVGPYADELLIPQLIELGKEYGTDGVWIDGEAWAVERDWSKSIRDRFTRQTGIEAIPVDKSDPNWHRWSQFQRELFGNYIRHCAAAIKEQVPGFAYCSNWGYSNLMPERPCDEVDFLSEDFPTAAENQGVIDHALYLARFLAGQGKPWDLMDWGFIKGDTPENRKSATQMKREAACVISQGGGFQVYYGQNRDGSVDLAKLRPFAEVARFCRQRQPFAFKGKAIPQVAVLFSTEGCYSRWDSEGNGLFNWDNRLEDSICRILLNNHLPASILVTDRLMEQMKSFPLTIVYQWETLEPELVCKLQEYVRGGGRLLLAGSSMRELFRDMIGAAGYGRPIGHGVTMFDLESGNFALIDKDNAPDEAVLTAIDILFTNRMVGVEGNPTVDLTLTRTAGGEIAVHLINATPPEDNAKLYDKIDPVGPMTLYVRLESAPRVITLQPEGTPLEWSFSNGIATIVVPSVPIYEIVVIEENTSAE